MEYSITEWVKLSSEDRKPFRQAVHIILLAISESEYLKPKMIMKGGMLLAIRYHSSRFTEDIDFSTSIERSNINEEEFVTEMDEALMIASEELPYGLRCQIQTIKKNPKSETATFPSYKLTIGFAYKSNIGGIRRLENKSSTHTVKIDYSFNEITCKKEEIILEDSESIFIYSLVDVLSEKIRAVIQQVYRKRSREQDVYDLFYLLNSVPAITNTEREDILSALFKKSIGKIPEKDINKNTLDREDIIASSQENYYLLKDQIEDELPDFDIAYDFVNTFYKSLW